MIKLDIHKRLLTSSGAFTLKANISIPKGEIVAFYGQSGSGKTTLLRILAGLTQPDKGLVEVDNECWFNSEYKYNMPANKRNAGFVFQDYALFPNMTVKENIRFAQNGKDNKYAQTLLEMLGLTTLQNRKPQMLSGGQQQRVALARALARKPDLLLLDEPLSALDNTIRAELQDEIKHINSKMGITTILVSHDVSEIFKLCSHVYSFNEGVIEDKGYPSGLFSNNQISGKVQFAGEVLYARQEDIISIITILVGNTPVKLAVPANGETFYPGDKVLIASKAFNPIIQKV